MQSLPLKPPAAVDLYEDFLDPEASARCLAALLDEVPLARQTIQMFGRQVPEPRLSAWLGDPDAVYTYSGTMRSPLPWTPTLTVLRDRVAAQLDHRFNGVLCNLYRDGSDSIGMHADDERELGPMPVIASLSLGATRRMRFAPRPGCAGEPLGVTLHAGSLLVMRGATQSLYKHGVPKQPRVRQPRLNLTFRLVGPRRAATESPAS